MANIREFVECRENCYWLGFLLGDGAVTKQPDSDVWALKLGLSARDKDHLREFSKWFGGNYSIRETESNGHPLINITVYNQDKIERLIELGVEPSKTQTVRMPDVPHTRDLVRGYSDADGHITQDKHNGFTWSIASINKDVLEDLEQRIPISDSTLYYNEAADAWYLNYTGYELADDVADYLYPDGADTEPALQRKREACLKKAAWSLKKTKDYKLENYA